MSITKRKLKQIIREVTGVMNESDRFHGVLPPELWESGDMEDLRDNPRMNLEIYNDDELLMKIEQLQEEIEEELRYLDDPQNQYDSAIFPKEDLVGYIQDILIKRGH